MLPRSGYINDRPYVISLHVRISTTWEVTPIRFIFQVSFHIEDPQPTLLNLLIY